jgi:hypothetical protein
MALIICKTCTANIAQEAKACPQCGANNPAAFKTVRFVGLIYFALVGALLYWILGLLTPVTPAARISPANFSEAWPFAVDQLDLLCEPGDAVIVVNPADGKRYGVNGAAIGRASELKLDSLEGIWVDNPQLPGTKISVSPVINQGIALCK